MTVGKTTELEQEPSQDSARESALIVRILAGERELYHDLIRPHERSVYLTGFSVLRNMADAEEVAQESILKGFRYLSQFRADSRFGTWLLKITLNEARMRLRKQHKELWESLDAQTDEEESDYVPQEFGDWREIPSEALERKEVREVLSTAVAALPEIYREVILLRDIRQFSVAETAQVLGVSTGVVKTRVLRARLQLRDLIAPMTTTQGFFSRNPFFKRKRPWS
ncbi:MAG: sigma-70 family RNA polymerase sigma factor [Candidatus Acidiferrum sp.]|jgi:RNA polymerase sigma-70 factor (ECF subfamily)